ncbi:hypothetical protein [Pannonibacter sp. SL95]|uniref:hypothetical protein n=1 Tax=Pannonibacter sp. SL95 TaxID=2995153 RepID=UPI0022769B37|nr:hypothetical protein [Pannonibacter sp. SL95]MCY1704474.1 hypothetical protein [Pannonibacter sp. SL95]MCY1707699.1 hypothetical protein [Pannonibacter sp. SL95]MCY1707740.1 hypothetical protein [Pannonibacter sp. SL95]
MGAIKLGLGPLAVTRQAPAWMGPFQLALDFRAGRYQLNRQQVGLSRIDSLYHSRASARRAEDSAGVSREFANGVMAVTDRGYDSREGWTNLIPNPLGTGAVVGVVGSGGALPTGWYVNTSHGMTTQIVGVSTVNGLPVIRFRVSGTSNGGFYELNLQPGAASSPAILPSAAYNVSGYMGVVAGAFPASGEFGFTQRRADQAQAVSVTLANTVTLNATPVLTRFNVNLTSAADAAFGRMRITMSPSNGAAVDVTFDIAAPQLTQTAYLMPFGSGTVAPDSIVVPAADAGLAVNPPLTVVWRGVPLSSAPSFATLLEIRAAANRRVSMFLRANGTLGIGVLEGGGNNTITNTGSVWAGTETTVVSTIRPDGTTWTKVGSDAHVTRSGVVVPLPGASQFALGSDTARTTQCNSQIRIAAVGAFALSDAEALNLFIAVAAS